MVFPDHTHLLFCHLPLYGLKSVFFVVYPLCNLPGRGSILLGIGICPAALPGGP